MTNGVIVAIVILAWAIGLGSCVWHAIAQLRDLHEWRASNPHASILVWTTSPSVQKRVLVLLAVVPLCLVVGLIGLFAME